jgi:Barrel-sandwich domain of CusB or HlyD membrane-fusion
MNKSSTISKSNDFAKPTRLMQVLPDIAAKSASEMAFYRELPAIIGREFAASYALIDISVGSQRDLENYHAQGIDPRFWQPQVEQSIAKSIAEASGKARIYGARDADLRVAILAVPIADGAVSGGIGLAIPVESQDDARAQLDRLQTAVAIARLAARNIESRNTIAPAPQAEANISGLVEAMASGSEKQNATQMAMAIVNQLRAKLACDAIALGKVARRRVVLMAISGHAEPAPRSPGSQLLRSAMEECLDLDQMIVCKPGDVTQFRMHCGLRDDSVGTVVSVPLKVAGESAYVLTIRFKADQAVEEANLKKIEAALQPYAASMRLVERATRSLPALAIDACRRLVKPATKSAMLRRGILAVSALLLVWLVFGSLTYRVTARGAIAPLQTYLTHASFDGRVAEALVSSGDRVKKGQPMLRFDVAPLESEKRRLESELLAATLKANQALAQSERGQARVHQAEADGLRAHLDLVQSRIAASVVVAPADVIVASENVSSLVGQHVSAGAPLLELIDAGGVSLRIHVPDVVVDDVSIDQTGVFALESEPNQARRFKVTRVGAQGGGQERQNTFEVKAELQETPDWMKPGMQGVARIEVGPRPAWWVVFHRVIDTARLYLWI